MSNKVPKSQPSLRSTYAERAQAAAHEAAAGERRRRTIGIVVGAVVAAAVVIGLTVVLVSRRSAEEAVPPSPLAIELGCSSCHTTDGQRSEGPTWKGLAGSTVQLADGSSVVADEDYLRRSITDPQAQIVAGYGPGMPQQQLSDAELDELVAFIESLR